MLEDQAELFGLFNLRGPVPPPTEVVVLAVDRAATRMTSLAPESTSLSPRRAHAIAVRALRDAGAAVIAFDLQFDALPDEAGSDEAFAAALRDANNVVLVETIRRDTQHIPAGGGHGSGSLIIDTPLPPAPLLRDAARGYGAFQLPRTSRVDAYWAFPSRADNRASLPVLAFHVFMLAVYQDVERVWRRAAVPGGSHPLPEVATLTRLQPSDAIARLRSTIGADPQGVARALAALDHTSASELPPERRRIARAVLSLYSGGPIRYLNYYGPPQTVPTLTYAALLDPSAPARNRELLRGKVVFIGYSGVTASEQDRIRDDYVTVFADPMGVQLSGVEIAATSFANILDANDVQRLPGGSRLLLVLIWGLVLGFLARLLRPARTVPAVLLLSGLYLAFATWVFRADALALPLLIPIGVQAPLALVLGTLLSYREARREREAIKQTFGYFLPRKVVDELAKGIGPLKDDNQLVNGAIVATDVERYSALAEQITPRELGRLMDDYFAELFIPVKERGGTVLDVAGDGMLAIWTSPSEDATFRRQACHALLDMAARVERFNARRADGRTLPTRMALHSGQLMLGSFGAVEHFEYRAVGDIVNTTSRIDGLNKFLGTWRLVSDATLEGLDDFVARPVGTFVLAGKTRPLAVSELLGRRVEADSRLEGLRRAFAEALAAYAAGDWRNAVEGFRTVLAEFPGDGPASFYLKRCTVLAQSARDPVWDPTVRLDAK